MEQVLHNGKLVALKLSEFSDGTLSATDSAEPLQVLTFKHPKGKFVAPHSHIPRERITHTLQECLVVVRGRLRVSFFDEEAQPIAAIEVGAGEACITLAAGHSVEFLEDSEVIEIKNGPFVEDKQPLTPPIS